MIFEVGETVVYPHHGAALIEALKTRVIKGEDRLYLVLKVAQRAQPVRVPADHAEFVGADAVCLPARSGCWPRPGRFWPASWRWPRARTRTRPRPSSTRFGPANHHSRRRCLTRTGEPGVRR